MAKKIEENLKSYGENKEYISDIKMTQKDSYYNLSANVYKFITFSKTELENILKNLELSNKNYYELSKDCNSVGENGKSLIIMLETPNYIKEATNFDGYKFAKPNEISFKDGKTYKFYITTLDMLEHKVTEDEKNDINFYTSRTYALEKIDKENDVYSFDSFNSVGRIDNTFDIRKIELYSIDLLPTEKVVLTFDTKDGNAILPDSYNVETTIEDYFLKNGNIKVNDKYTVNSLSSSISTYIEKVENGTVDIRVIY